jgi:fatty-acyl-CoA synthase
MILQSIIIPLLFGTTNVFPFYFPETSFAMRFIEKYKCNTYRGTPTQFIDLLNHPERKKYDLSSLKNILVAGSTVNADLLGRMQNELGIEDAFVGYG